MIIGKLAEPVDAREQGHRGPGQPVCVPLRTLSGMRETSGAEAIPPTDAAG